MDVALVNTNRIKPPIAPIGLDYVAEALHVAGHHVRVLDLCWENDVSAAIAEFFQPPRSPESGLPGPGPHERYGLVGVTMRNTDDCAFTSRQSFLAPFVEIVRQIRQYTLAPIVVGGVGFSVMPERVLSHVDQLSPGSVDAGVWGEGEFVFPQLAACLEDSASTKVPAWRELPNVLWRQRLEDGTCRWRRNPPAYAPLAELPAMSRRWVDNVRYFERGG